MIEIRIDEETKELLEIYMANHGIISIEKAIKQILKNKIEGEENE